MSDSRYKALDQFGEGVMTEVRDEALGFFDRLTAGRMSDSRSQKLYASYCKLNSDDMELMRQIIVEAVDAAIAQFLHYLDESAFQLFAGKDADKKHDIVAASDGLVGELYGDDGWKARFSRYPR